MVVSTPLDKTLATHYSTRSPKGGGLSPLLPQEPGGCNGAPLTVLLLLPNRPTGPRPLAQDSIAALAASGVVAPTIRPLSPSPAPPLAHCPLNLHRTRSRPSLTVMRTFPAAVAVATTSSVSAAPFTVGV